MIRNPVVMDEGGPIINSLAPNLGQHTLEILKTIGIDNTEYEKLILDGITL